MKRPHPSNVTTGVVAIVLITSSCDSGTRSAIRGAMAPQMPSAAIDSLYVSSDSTFVVAATLNGQPTSVTLSTRLLQAIVVQQRHLEANGSGGNEDDGRGDSPEPVVDPYRATSRYNNSEYVISHTRSWITVAGVGDSLVAAHIPSDIVSNMSRIHTHVFAEPTRFGVGYDDQSGHLRVSLDESVRMTSVVGVGLGGLTLIAVGLLVQALRVRRTSSRFRRRIIATREAERRRIASDLHDGPMQQLHHLMFQCDRASNGDPSLPALRDDLRKVNRELRDICLELRPPILTHFGLAHALNVLVSEWSNRFPSVAVRLNAEPDFSDVVDQTVQVAIYRTVQESLNNVIKHSGASEVLIRAQRRGTTLATSVRDNGCGFAGRTNWSNLEETGHLGLSLAAQRAESVGGRLSIRSATGKGTTLTLVVPCRSKTRRPLRSIATPRFAEST